ncbi:MAG: FAD-dependent oxidoreductase [Myxococcales bacterium]|nr:FAD-dependent oxidoreductase [Myxococcales bacterium]MCB9701026.1 FAD-dependent oxidoreductase [Myxococcales bacterium]
MTAHSVFWQAEIPRPRRAALRGDRRADVLIVGAGFTGLAAARALKAAEPGLKIVVVDRDFVGYGASGRNSGFLTPLIGHDLHSLRRRFGDERARLIADVGRDAVRGVIETIERDQIACDLEATGLANPGVSPAHLRAIDRLCAAADALGVPHERWDEGRTRGELGVEWLRGAFYLREGGILQPFKLAQGLAALAEREGIEILEGSPIDRIEPGPMVRAQGPGGSISAPMGVIATNAYTRTPSSYRWHYAPIHVYSVVSAPLRPEQLAAIGGWPGRVGFYTLHHILYAMRLTADNRILAATGEVRYFSGDRLHVAERPADYAMLQRSIAWMWPALADLEIEHRWEGVIGMTLSDLPSVGRHRRYPNLVHSLAYCGHGVALANHAGGMVRDLLLGRPSVADLLPFVRHRPLPPVPLEPLRTPVAAAYLAVLRGLDRLSDRHAPRRRRR